MFEGLLGEEGLEMAKKANKEEEVFPFLQSKFIKQLGQKNFTRYIGEKGVALVFFYQPDCPNCSTVKPHFLKAAKTTKPAKTKGYAIVDCTKDRELCQAENVYRFPTFKLYVGGKHSANYEEALNHNVMRQFVEEAAETLPGKAKKKVNREDL